MNIDGIVISSGKIKLENIAEFIKQHKMDDYGDRDIISLKDIHITVMDKMDFYDNEPRVFLFKINTVGFKNKTDFITFKAPSINDKEIKYAWFDEEILLNHIKECFKRNEKELIEKGYKR